MHMNRREVLKALAVAPFAGVVAKSAVVPVSNWMRFTETTHVCYSLWQHMEKAIATGDYTWELPYQTAWYAMVGASDDNLRLAVGAARIGGEQFIELGPTEKELSSMNSKDALHLCRNALPYFKLVCAADCAEFRKKHPA